MLHDILPMVYDNHWETRKVSQGDLLVAVNGRKILVKVEGNEVSLPIFGVDLTVFQTEYLFRIDDHFFFLAEESVEEFGDYHYVNINAVRSFDPMWMVYACSNAMSLASWYQNNSYCGHCGKRTHKSVVERAIVCDDCHLTNYPKICPGIIAAVISGDGERIAMTKAKGRDHWALVSGFTEIGEPIEDTVKREVEEEIGLTVKNIRFYRSQPWPFSDSLLCGFFCEVDGDDTIKVDPWELDDAKWVKRADVPPKTNNTSLTQEMIALFKDGRY